MIGRLLAAVITGRIKRGATWYDFRWYSYEYLGSFPLCR